MHVHWNAARSTPFSLRSGVKQEGGFSPIVFSIYIDSSLHKLQDSGIGCHVGHTFAGALGYAYDLSMGCVRFVSSMPWNIPVFLTLSNQSECVSILFLPTSHTLHFVVNLLKL